MTSFIVKVGVCAVFLMLSSVLIAQQRVSAETTEQLSVEKPSLVGEPTTLPTSGASVAASAAEAPTTELRIGVGDLLKVGVLGAPEFDQELRVDGGGNIKVALVGVIHVAGLTPGEAGQAIRTRLTEGSYFADPQVSVFEKEYATQGISVLGEVQRPGVYPLLGPRRLFDALSLAGGTTPKAGRIINLSHRDQPELVNSVTLSRDPTENMKANVEVFPGDTVVVSKAGIVYVVGAVRLPTGIVMENGGNITVLQAIAVAGGANTSAALNGARIIRKGAEGPKEIPIRLKKILTAKAPDITLEAEDIVFVPQSASKTAAGAAAQAAVRIAASLASYSVIY